MGGAAPLGRSAAKSREHVFGDRPRVQRLAGRLRTAHPRTTSKPCEHSREPTEISCSIRKCLRLHPGDFRPDREHVAVPGGAQELRAGFDDGHADDVVLRKRLGPRQAQSDANNASQPEVAPLEEAR